MPAETACAVVPEPAEGDAVFNPYESEVPYSNHQVVDRPFGVTCPRRGAVVTATGLASAVTATGAELVVKVASAPVEVPASLFATILKWYVLPTWRFAMATASFCGLDPEPPLLTAVFVP